jgi:predicted alpha/beta hydrolase family esterase
MKQSVLLHGTDGSNTDYFWFGGTKNYLESKGYAVWWPLLPRTNKPLLEESLEFVELNVPPLDRDSIIIGHSSACPLILSWLENSMMRIKQVVLVGGFYQPIDDPKQGGISHLMLPADGFDYDRIRSAADEVVLIKSDNDPWGCNDKQARPIAEALDAKFVLAKGQGHMGSMGFNQPMPELPLLKDVLTA